MNETKRNVFLFLGIGLMLLFATFSYTVLRDIQSTITIQKLSAAVIPKMKMASVPVILLFGLLFFFLCRKGKIHRGFILFFLLNIIIWGGLLFLKGSDDLWIYWVYSIWSSVSMSLSLILIWGFANQEFTFKKAAIQYPLLGLIFSSSGAFLGGHLTGHFAGQDLFSKIYPMTLWIGVGANLLIFVIYLILKHYPYMGKEQGSRVTWGYWVALGILLFGIKTSALCLQITFKNEVRKVFTNATSYIEFMGNFSKLSGSIRIGLGVLAIGLGVLLFFRGAQAFFKVFGSVLLGIIVFALFTFFIPKIDINALAYALFSGSIGIILSLRELAFFGIQRESRFTAKIVLDLIFGFFATGFGTTLIQLPIMFVGTIDRNINAAVFLVIIIVCLLALYRVRKDLKWGIPKVI
ncbi:MAG: hypothetical protein KDK96_07445 [Chlamydiia bacterium]|nr:hypothetical protein [Chlamydiia bacterium]